MTEVQHLDITTLLTNLEQALKKEINARNLKNPLIIGIHTGGAWIAEKLSMPSTKKPIGLVFPD